MISLNLKANDEQQEIIKNYLQENVSETLAEKINNGVSIEKDGKPFISKKDLDGFMEYAGKLAQEQAGKGKRSAMVKDDVVFGWAIHYFEEDSIEGRLFNPDGTPYSPPKPKYQHKPTTTPPAPVKHVKKPDIQPNMFDLLCENNDAENTEENDEDITEEDMQEGLNELVKEETKVSPLYTQYLEIQKKYPDCIVALKVGDFYEVFGDNAVRISNELELTLTARDVGLKERIPIIGFPYHVSDVYFQKMINKGHKIAVAENNNSFILKNDEKIDLETGEILNATPSVDALKQLFGNAMEIKL